MPMHVWWCWPEVEKKLQKAMLSTLEREAKAAEQERRRLARVLRQIARSDSEEDPLSADDMEGESEARANGAHLSGEPGLSGGADCTTSISVEEMQADEEAVANGLTEVGSNSAPYSRAPAMHVSECVGTSQ